MAIAWTLSQKGISSVLIGVSRLSQLESNLKTLDALDFNEVELSQIDLILNS